MYMHWAVAMAYAKQQEEEKQREEKQRQCPHKNVAIDEILHRWKRTEHADGRGYTMRLAGRIRCGYCRDCKALVDETEPGSNVYELTPIVC